MKNNLYCVYNELSARYGDVVCYPTDGFALARLSQTFQMQHADLKEFTVCRVGTIDIETGVVCSESPVRLPWSLPSPIEQDISADK